MANAFACRSSSLRPGQLGWFSNRVLVLAVVCEAAMLVCFLYVPPVATILRHAPPNGTSYLAALLAVPAVFAVDALDKQYRRKAKTTHA